jgi:hypothetical protein
MAARLFCYNPHPNGAISGTEQVGDIAAVTGVVVPDTSLEWWNGPDEDSGYIIAYTDPTGNRPNAPERILAVNYTCHIGFFRTPVKTEQSFVDLTQIVTGNYSLTNGSDAKTYLNNNGFWTSYTASVIPTLDGEYYFFMDASDNSSYNGVGPIWYDTTDNNLPGSLNSGVTFSSNDGGYFDFDGVDDTVSISDSWPLNLSTGQYRTFQVWTKIDTLPVSGFKPIFGKLSSSYAFDGYYLAVNSDATIRCATNGGSIAKTSTSTATISTGQWYFITFTTVISATAGSTKVWLNTTQIISATHGTDTYSEANTFYMGYIGAGVSSQYFDGKIGSLYIYGKDFDSSLVQNNFDATKTRFGL